MSNADLIFLLLALTNMDIGLNNYSQNTGQQQGQENIKIYLDKIYSKLLEIEKELNQDANSVSKQH
nr:MAG TPA: hypothetical protein [Caudoviricetes sp.]